MRYAIVRFTNIVDFENAGFWNLPTEGTPKKKDVVDAIKAKAQEVGASVGGFSWEIVKDEEGDYWCMMFNEILCFDISQCPKGLAAWEIICMDETPLKEFAKFSDPDNDCSITASKFPIGAIANTIKWDIDNDEA